MRIVRVLRGIVATAMTWAGLWVPFSLLPIGVAALTGNPFSLRIVTALLIGQAVIGAINGTVFASVLAIAGRRKTFESLSLPWIAVCGAIGGALFPVVIRTVLLSTMDIAIPAPALVWSFVTNTLLGAGCATLTLSIARRAPALRDRNDAALPDIDAGALVARIATEDGR